MQISTALSRAIVAFAATNLDDIFVLTFFFAQKNLQIWRVVLGQYLGIAGLILVSLAGFFASLIIPYKWIGLLGLIPIGIGIRNLIALKEEQAEKIGVKRVESSLTVAAITFANGGDNIAIYTPLFASSTWATLTITLITFLVMIALWCVAGLCDWQSLRCDPIDRSIWPHPRAVHFYRTRLLHSSRLSKPSMSKTPGASHLLKTSVKLLHSNCVKISYVRERHPKPTAQLCHPECL